MAGADRLCTIVARNYVAQARVLVASAAQHAPDSPFTTLLIDGDEGDRALEGIGEVLMPTDLGLDPVLVGEMRLIYDVMEYATALKPALLMRLLRRSTRTATYLDPDIRLFAPVDEVFEAAATSGLALTPHTMEPIPRDGRMLDEAVVMHAGIYNLGFVAASGAAMQFLAWWHDRLRTDAIVDLGSALFTDQRWMDWAPALARPQILKDKGFNAAYWNLHERPLARDGETWTVGGRPLRFFHFSGYDPATPLLLSKHQGGAPRNLFSEQPLLRELCDGYARELTDAGHLEMRKNPYRHGTLSSGLRLTSAIRRLCRDALTSDDPVLLKPPDPWLDEPAFLDWLLAPELHAGHHTFSRFELAIWRGRPDLRVAFADPLVSSAAFFRKWLDESSEMAAYRADAAAPTREARLTKLHVPRRHPLGGWSVLSYANAELGVGEAGRRLSTAVAHSGLPWEMVGLREGPASRQHHTYRGALSRVAGYANQILCANADQTPRLASSLGPRHADARRIGYWFWELDAFPANLHAAFDHVDEIWVSSEFNRAAIAASTDKPVHVVPVPAHRTTPVARYSRRQLGLPEGAFVVLANFDYLSVAKRKNPIGAIEAYSRAFGPEDGAVLVVKSINGHLRLVDREQVRAAAAGRPDIILREDYLLADQMHALAALADCVLSLHRSEGFGLNLLDAMAQGTPVVATAYSGNMQFMDEHSAFLVPYTLTEVGAGAAPYDSNAVWADPDLDVAAAHLRTIVEDSQRTAEVVQAAHARVAALSPHNVGLIVQRLLLPDLVATYTKGTLECAS